MVVHASDFFNRPGRFFGRLTRDGLLKQTSVLGSVFRRCLMRWPFTVNAIVLLPDHLHAIWSLPPGDDEYSRRWGWIRKEE